MPYADPVKERDYRRRYQRAWKKRHVARWKAAGACVRCGLPVKRFARCLECRRKLAAIQRRSTRKRLTRPCVQCGKPAYRGAKTKTGMCAKCQCRLANWIRWNRVKTEAA